MSKGAAMSDILSRIKQVVRKGNVDFSEKARLEMLADGLDDDDVIESILLATEIRKTLRSSSPRRLATREYLHIIESPNLSGVVIYTKGTLRKYGGVYYFMVSAKLSL